jgi:cyanamide hydratase
MCQHEIASNGWTSMPVDAGVIFGDKPFINEPENLFISEIKFPSDDPVVAKTFDYAKKVLHPAAFNHSMRVYYYGEARQAAGCSNSII